MSNEKQEVYNRVMNFVKTTKDIETLRKILLDSLDNGPEELMDDAYDFYIKEKQSEYLVKWQQHDENGNPSRRREDTFFAESEKDAWKQAYSEGEHQSDYLISVSRLTDEA